MTSPNTTAPPTSLPILVIAISFFVLAVSITCRAFLGLGMQEWSVALGWSRGEISVAGSVALMVMAGTVTLAGHAADRWGSRLILGFGCCAFVAGLSIVSAMTSYWQLIVGYGLLCGLGIGLVSMPVVGSLVARHAQTRQGLATGLATSGASGGQFLIVPVLAALFPVIGWRSTVVVFAALAGLAAIAVFMGLGASRVGVGAGNKATAHGHGVSGLSSILRTRAFQGLFWSFTICGFTSTGIVETHFIPFAQTCGFTTVASANAYAIFAIFNLAGMIAAGILADRMDRRVLLASLYVIRSIASILPLFVGMNYPVLLGFSVLVGIAFYATFPVTIGLSAAHFGVGRLGLVGGLLTLGHSLGAAVGAAFGGYIYDLFLRYDLMWISAVAVGMVAALFALLVSDPRSDDKRRAKTPTIDATELALKT